MDVHQARRTIDDIGSGELGFHDDEARRIELIPMAVADIGHKHVYYNALKNSIIHDPEFEV